eukprot:9747341-Prorocentrum_lima.AAC.1
MIASCGKVGIGSWAKLCLSRSGSWPHSLNRWEDLESTFWVSFARLPTLLHGSRQRDESPN